MEIAGQREVSPTKDGLRLKVNREEEGRIRVTLESGGQGSILNAELRSLRKVLDSGEADLLAVSDSGFEQTEGPAVAVVLECLRMAEKAGVERDLSGLSEDMGRLIELAMAVPMPSRRTDPSLGIIEQVGRKAVEVLHQCRILIEFLGELVYSFGRLLTGKARFRHRDFWRILQECGVSALPIVALLSILTGTILGFIGAVQLRKFGATIYMTDLVGLAMAREMACLMTGIIMSGRTGAAFAAHIGSMEVNEEINALRTFGLSPIEFLVLPRTLALFLMLPLLTLFSNVLGWTGGFLVALPMGINPVEYWQQLQASLQVSDILFGLSKAFVFGLVIAVSGCYYGLQSERNTAVVGRAATRAVVAGITWIVVLDAIFAFMDETLSW